MIRAMKTISITNNRVLSFERIFTVPPASLDPLLNPGLEWTVDKEQCFSRSRNTPFHGREVKGRAVRTIVGGKTVWSL